MFKLALLSTKIIINTNKSKPIVSNWTKVTSIVAIIALIISVISTLATWKQVKFSSENINNQCKNIDNQQKRNKSLDKANADKESIKAIERFYDKIIPKLEEVEPKINKVLIAKKNKDTYELKKNSRKVVFLLTQIVICINGWAAFVVSPISNNKIIKNTLSGILQYYSDNDDLYRVARHLHVKRPYEVKNYMKLMRKFNISK